MKVAKTLKTAVESRYFMKRVGTYSKPFYTIGVPRAIAII